MKTYSYIWKKSLASAIVAGVLSLSLISCGKQNEAPIAASTDSASSQKNILYVYNWTEYVPTSLLKKFTEETGIEIRYTTYESNEEMYSKLKLVNGEGYDLIFPSSYFIPLLKKEGLIQPLDKTRVNIDKVIPELLNKPFDPNNEYSVPYSYGFTTIGVNTQVYEVSKIKGWKDLWKPEYKNLVMLNDVLDNFSVALLSRGVDPNNATDDEVKQANNDLKDLIGKVSQFNSDSPEVPYVDGSADIGMIWTGSAFRANQETKGKIDVVYPEEGAVLWMDNFAITSKAKNVDAAYKFINFILEPKNSYEIIKEMGFQTSSNEVKSLLPEEWQNNHILYPSKEVYDKAVLNYIPTERLHLYIELWNTLKVE